MSAQPCRCSSPRSDLSHITVGEAVGLISDSPTAATVLQRLG